ncbi:MAG: hypothetical protein B7Z10_07360 [Rhodobacterales bacterium 32-66-7]|nr:MAG: hypothetical protein B7Z10_07360 [Rhodobacterales bacterium 32-66-7]
MTRSTPSPRHRCPPSGPTAIGSTRGSPRGWRAPPPEARRDRPAARPARQRRPRYQVPASPPGAPARTVRPDGAIQCR